jgi:hypothetical protein
MLVSSEIGPRALAVTARVYPLAHRFPVKAVRQVIDGVRPLQQPVDVGDEIGGKIKSENTSNFTHLIADDISS